MSEILLNSLGETQAKWLSVRQALIATNVANANVPGFKAQDVRPMDDSQAMFSNLLQTDDRHVASRLGNVNGIGTSTSSTWETFHSGGNVSVSQEMMKASEVASAYQMNTSVMRAFHSMVIAAFGT